MREQKRRQEQEKTKSGDEDSAHASAGDELKKNTAKVGDKSSGVGPAPDSDSDFSAKLRGSELLVDKEIDKMTIPRKKSVKVTIQSERDSSSELSSISSVRESNMTKRSKSARSTVKLTKKEIKLKNMRKQARKATGEFICDRCKELSSTDKKDQQAVNNEGDQKADQKRNG